MSEKRGDGAGLAAAFGPSDDGGCRVVSARDGGGCSATSDSELLVHKFDVPGYSKTFLSLETAFSDRLMRAMRGLGEPDEVDVSPLLRHEPDRPLKADYGLATTCQGCAK